MLNIFRDVTCLSDLNLSCLQKSAKKKWSRSISAKLLNTFLGSKLYTSSKLNQVRRLNSAYSLPSSNVTFGFQQFKKPSNSLKYLTLIPRALNTMEWLFKGGTVSYMDLTGLYRCVVKRPEPEWFLETTWNPHFMSSDLLCLLAATPACTNAVTREQGRFLMCEMLFIYLFLMKSYNNCIVALWFIGVCFFFSFFFLPFKNLRFYCSRLRCDKHPSNTPTVPGTPTSK